MTETLSNVLVESYRTLFLRAFLSLLIPELDGGLLAPPPHHGDVGSDPHLVAGYRTPCECQLNFIDHTASTLNERRTPEAGTI